MNLRGIQVSWSNYIKKHFQKYLKQVGWLVFFPFFRLPQLYFSTLSKPFPLLMKDFPFLSQTTQLHISGPIVHSFPAYFRSEQNRISQFTEHSHSIYWYANHLSFFSTAQLFLNPHSRLYQLLVSLESPVNFSF